MIEPDPELDSLLELFHVCPTGLLSFGADGDIRLVNPEAVNLLLPALGMRAFDNVFELFSGSWPELASLLAANPRIGKIIENHRLAIGSEPNVVWLSLSVVRADIDHNLVVLSDITRQYQAEASIREREHNLRKLFDSIDEGYCVAEMIVDAEGAPADYRFVEVNPRFEEMTGLREPVGRTALELVPDLESSWIEMYARVGLGKETVRFEQGSEAMGRFFEVFSMPVEPHGSFAIVFRDQTERHRWETALADSEQFTRRVLDNLFAFVGVLTPDGTLVEANRAPLEAAGLELSDVVGKKFWDCFWWSYSPDVQQEIRGAVERAASGELVRFDVPVRVLADGRMWIDFQIAPLRDDEGVITHLVPSGLDLSERKAAELERAGLLEAEHQARIRIELLERNATHLAATTTVGELASSVLNDVQSALGIVVATLNILETDAIRTIPSPAVQAEAAVLGLLTGQDIRVELDAGLPGPKAIRTNRTALLNTAEEIRTAFPDFADTLVRLPVRSLIAAPLRSADGSVLGALVVASEQEQWLDEATVSLLQGIADQTGLALERAQLFEKVLLAREQEHAVAIRLQEALLPDQVINHVDLPIAASYRAASEVLAVGGDWFDTFMWPTGQVGIVVGDVVGHDLDATAAMGRIRAAMAALAPLTEPRPAALLSALDHCATGLNGTDFVTAACVVIDPKTGDVVYGSAGHPPPLIIAPDGTPTWLHAATTAPAGKFFRGSRREASVTIEPGAVLILYSDGLVERRGETMDVGLSRLAAAAVSLSATDVDAIPDQLIAALTVEQSAEDDIITIVARWEPLADRFRRRFIADTTALAPLRADLRSWLERHTIRPAARDDIILAIGEGVTNAVEHAYLDGPAGPVEVTVDRQGQSLEVHLLDEGTWRPLSPDGSDRGRGLPIMRAIATHFDRSTTNNGTDLTLHLPAPQLEPDASS